ncbi:MAG: FAD-dependent oxidoreductase [Dehalococcoidia bacterium]
MTDEQRQTGGGHPHEREVTVGVARVAVTEHPDHAPPAQSAVHLAPVREEVMPKEGMRIEPQPPDGIFDVTIIGAGPTGLYAAFYAGMREMSVKVIDSLGDLGGQVTALYPEKFIYDVAGYPQVKGKDLVSACVEQGLQFGATVSLGERIERLQRQEDGNFTLSSRTGEHRSRTVIISAGVGAFAPRKLPGIADLEDLEGKSVFYFVRDLETFRDKRLLIVGGGDSAMDWALNLEPVARQITLIHRRDRWRAHEDTVNKVMDSSVDVQTFHEVRRVNRDNGTLRGVTIFDNRTGAETELDVDLMVLCLGFIANIGPIREWGLEIVDGGIAVDSTMATNIPGVFAAGDVARYHGKLNLISTGFGRRRSPPATPRPIDPQSRALTATHRRNPPKGASATRTMARSQQGAAWGSEPGGASAPGASWVRRLAPGAPAPERGRAERHRPRGLAWPARRLPD